jgi:hypothetical protein
MSTKKVTQRTNFGRVTYHNIWWVAKADMSVPEKLSDREWKILRMKIRQSLETLTRREYRTRVDGDYKSAQNWNTTAIRERNELFEKGVVFLKILLYEDKSWSVTDKLAGADTPEEVKF